MTPLTNENRAAAAASAVLQYAISKEGGDELYDEANTVLIDLLTDLMHWAEQEDIDFPSCLRQATYHYAAEKRP